MKTLIDLFETFKNKREEVFVYRTGIRRFTFKYRELYKSSLKMAQYFKEQGIERGDKVAIWAQNSPFWAVSYFGVLNSSAIVIPVDFASSRERAETILKLSGAKFLIQSNYKFEKVFGIKSVVIEDLPFILKSKNLIKKIIHQKPGDICEIVYTSGTTGDPKGVVLTHKNIVSNILAAVEHIKIPSRFNFLSVLPLSHMLEQTVGFLTPLFRGDKIIYIRTIKPSSILGAFSEENINAMVAVPRVLSILKNTIERELSVRGLAFLLKFKFTKKILSYPIRRKIGRNFEMFFCGGANLPLDVFSFWQDLGFKIIEGYGLTECSPIVSANTFDKQIAGSVGKPISGVKVKLYKKELLVKGENVFSSYYNNPKETEKAFLNGWFRTGDFAQINSNGNIFLKGRKKDVIVNASGINVYPDEVEQVLNKIPGIKDSAVLGLDKGKGEIVHAVLLLRDKSFNTQEIIKKANEKLDPLSQIEDFSVWGDYDFPRTTTLKIQKFKVREKVLSKSKKEEKKTVDTLISLLANVSKKSVNEISENSILTSDLGLNSLSRLELINFLEQEYRVDLEDTSITQNTTVSDLRKLLEKSQKEKRNGLWLWLNNPIGRFLREFIDVSFQEPLSALFFDLQTYGLSNLQNLKTPVVFISNHISYLDQPVIMAALPRKLRYKTATAAREEFFFSQSGTPIFRKILFPYTMIAFNSFLIPQKSGFRKSLSFMGKLTDRNVNILVFPEGERTHDGKIGLFMQGLGLMVKELQVPVVPIRILGMEKIYPRGAKFPKKGNVTVIFGKPIEFTTETPSQITEVSRKAMLEL